MDFTLTSTTTEALTEVTNFLGTYWGQAIGFTIALLAFAFGFVLVIAGIRWAWRKVRRIGA